MGPTMATDCDHFLCHRAVGAHVKWRTIRGQGIKHSLGMELVVRVRPPTRHNNPLAPATSPMAPVISTRAPATSTLAPATSPLSQVTKCMAPAITHLAPTKIPQTFYPALHS